MGHKHGGVSFTSLCMGMIFWLILNEFVVAGVKITVADGEKEVDAFKVRYERMNLTVATYSGNLGPAPYKDGAGCLHGVPNGGNPWQDMKKHEAADEATEKKLNEFAAMYNVRCKSGKCVFTPKTEDLFVCSGGSTLTLSNSQLLPLFFIKLGILKISR